MRLLPNRGNNLRRRQYRKLQKLDVAEISSQHRPVPVAALWQFGGYGQNNAPDGAYQVQAGADIPTWGKSVLSVDAIYSLFRDSVWTSLAPGSNDANRVPIPPFLPQTLTATISNNEAVMGVARYTTGPLKLYAGYEWIRYMAPSDSQTALHRGRLRLQHGFWRQRPRRATRFCR
jgi:hypothetical protein